jgi:tetratricopeptide (TPR) repeat protein
VTPRAWLTAAVLAICIGGVFLPALHAPFVFDDSATIVENASIRKLWPPLGTQENPGPLNAPPGTPTAGRPLVNLSLAINYHLGGLDPAGYHAFSIVIHFLTAMLIWAVVRRTLLVRYFASRFERSAGWLALAIAVLWALHPLQTESVIYATQRSELMMGLFYLATLYCSLRYLSDKPNHPAVVLGDEALPLSSDGTKWLTLAVLSCAFGMASKEVMVSAPLMVLLYDRTFISGSLTRALGRSRPLYIGLAPTWLLLLWLRVGVPHSEAAGFGLGVPAVSWWLTQTKIFLLYLKLAIWPWPLLIHYQFPYLHTLAAAWMYVLPVLILGVITLVLLWRNHPVGFSGTWIFAILSPTFVVPIIIEMAAERRMYLPLAPLIVLAVLTPYLLLVRIVRGPTVFPRALLRGNRPLVAFTAATMLLGIAYALVSTQRLAAYSSAFRLWDEVLQLQPENDTAHVSIGHEYEEAGNLLAATEHYRQAIRLGRDPALAHFKLGVALMKQGDHGEAILHFTEAARLQPPNALIRNNLAASLFLAGRTPEAITACRAALELQPKSWWCHNHLGMALKKVGNYGEAIQSFERAIELNPNDLAMYIDLADCFGRTNQPQKAVATLERALEHATAQRDQANIENFRIRLDRIRKPSDPVVRKEFAIGLFNAGQLPEAVDELSSALKLNPDDPSILKCLGVALTQMDRAPQAIEHLQHAARIQPNDVDTHASLAQAFMNVDRLPEAIGEYQLIVARKPDDPLALNNLGVALAKADRLPEALEVFQNALRLKADDVGTHNNLGLALSRLGKTPQAIEHFRLALKLDPNDADAHFNLGNVLASAGDMEPAISEFHRAVRLRPNQSDLRDTLGKALWRVGRRKEAIEVYRAAVAAHPGFLPAYSNLAHALMRENQSEEAIDVAKRGIKAARSGGDEAVADQIEEWLKHYQIELKRAADPDSLGSTSKAQEPASTQ